MSTKPESKPPAAAVTAGAATTAAKPEPTTVLELLEEDDEFEVSGEIISVRIVEYLFRWDFEPDGRSVLLCCNTGLGHIVLYS
jgi:hypothetical protein